MNRLLLILSSSIFFTACGSVPVIDSIDQASDGLVGFLRGEKTKGYSSHSGAYEDESYHHSYESHAYEEGGDNNTYDDGYSADNSYDNGQGYDDNSSYNDPPPVQVAYQESPYRDSDDDYRDEDIDVVDIEPRGDALQEYVKNLESLAALVNTYKVMGIAERTPDQLNTNHLGVSIGIGAMLVAMETNKAELEQWSLERRTKGWSTYSGDIERYNTLIYSNVDEIVANENVDKATKKTIKDIKLLDKQALLAN